MRSATSMATTRPCASFEVTKPSSEVARMQGCSISIFSRHLSCHLSSHFLVQAPNNFELLKENKKNENWTFDWLQSIELEELLWTLVPPVRQFDDKNYKHGELSIILKKSFSILRRKICSTQWYQNNLSLITRKICRYFPRGSIR